MPVNENINPPIVPAANENQNDSVCPPIKNGIIPKEVERMVIIIGTILILNDLM